MSDWKGNKNSVAAMLGMKTTWHPELREKDDFYATDPCAVRTLLDSENFCVFPMMIMDGRTHRKENYVIWECVCGEGNISKILEEYGYSVLSTDLVDRGFGIVGIDFLKVKKLPENCKVIMTNPPYKYADAFILHALELLPDDGYAVFLLNINYLAGLKRYYEIYNKGVLEAVYIYSNRVKCYKNNINNFSSSPVNYAWFVFTKRPYDSAPYICWLQIPK